jgi:hypothetical protein
VRAKPKTQALQALTDDFRAKRINLYKQILEFEAQLVCYFSTSKVEQTIRDLIKYNSWDGMVEDIKKMGKLSDSDRQIIDAEKMKAGFEKLESGMQDALDELHGISKSIEAEFSTLRRREEGKLIGNSGIIKSLNHIIDRERRDVLGWLSPLDFRTTQIDTLSRKQEGTGQWLFKDPAFKRWLCGAERTLWCSGIRMSFFGLSIYLESQLINCQLERARPSSRT